MLFNAFSFLFLYRIILALLSLFFYSLNIIVSADEIAFVCQYNGMSQNVQPNTDRIP